VSRKREHDEEPATVSVSGMAFALMAVDLPVWMDAPAAWEASDAVERNEYMARARFVLDVAETTRHAPGELRWEEGRPEHMHPAALASLPQVARTHRGLQITTPARPHPVQLGDQRAECTCGRWQFEDEPEPSKHITGCAVTQLVEWAPGGGD